MIPSTKAIEWSELEAIIKDRLAGGVSICITTDTGEKNRGGYFFHIKRTDVGYVFRTFDRDNVQTFTNPEDCAEFINHVSGRQYSARMWLISQNVNLRSDEEAAGEPSQED